MLKREGALYRAHIVRLSKGVVFVALLGALIEREGGTFRAHFACLSKVVFFLALLGAPVRGI